MNCEKPKVIEDARYSVREVTQMLGISRSTLYRYTEKGIVKCGRRRTNGRPFYTGKSVLKLWLAVI